jgi:hypothetical protein
MYKTLNPISSHQNKVIEFMVNQDRNVSYICRANVSDVIKAVHSIISVTHLCCNGQYGRCDQLHRRDLKEKKKM